MEQAAEAIAAFRPRRPVGEADDLHALAPEDLVEGGAELGVAITEQEPGAQSPFLQVPGQVPPCWMTHAPLRRCSRRGGRDGCRTSIQNSTWSWVSQTVSITKSQPPGSDRRAGERIRARCAGLGEALAVCRGDRAVCGRSSGSGGGVRCSHATISCRPPRPWRAAGAASNPDQLAAVPPLTCPPDPGHRLPHGHPATRSGSSACICFLHRARQSPCPPGWLHRQSIGQLGGPAGTAAGMADRRRRTEASVPTA
jgi:hypothetical protein